MIEERFCPPTAPLLSIAMIGISARPAGSLGKMLHQLCDYTEGAALTFLLQTLAAEDGPFRRLLRCNDMSAVGGISIMPKRRAEASAFLNQ